MFSLIKILLISKIGVAGGLGGFGIYGVSPDMSSINEVLKRNGYSEIKSTLFGWGGGGYGVIGNLWIGGAGFGTSQEISSNNTYVKVSYSGGFFEMGYTLFNTKFVSIVPSLGLGSSELKMRFIPVNKDTDFDSLLVNPARSSELRISSMGIYPSLNFLIPIKSFGVTFTFVFLKVGYNFSLSPSWEIDGKYSVLNKPDFSPRGLTFSFNIMFGGFGTSGGIEDE